MNEGRNSGNVTQFRGKNVITRHKCAVCGRTELDNDQLEEIEDEFGRKVRMNRRILEKILPDINLINIFKYKWFSYFYFGHRTCRYLLWISHVIVLISNAILITDSLFYVMIFMVQVLIYLLAIIGAITKTNNKYVTMIYYYIVTVIAQWVGVYNILTGKAKPFWEKAESTR